LRAFIPYSDYTQLDVYIATAQETLAHLPALPDGYTAESIQALRDALSAAQGLARNLSYEEQATVDAAAEALYAATYGLTFILPPAINPIPESAKDFYGNPITPIINTARKFIFGLSQGGLKDGMITTVGGASLIIKKAKNGTYEMGTGTGAKVTLVSQGMMLSTYTVIVFGDVNGDGNMDDGDTGMIIDQENYIYNWASRADLRYAGDVNGDGVVTGVDAGVVTNTLNYICTIDQTTGHYVA